MFDLGSGELLVIGIVALVVIGPKELPGLLRTVGQAVTRLRRIAGDFQGQFQNALREADLHDAVKSVSEIRTSVSDVTSFNDPLAGLPHPPMPQAMTAPPSELVVPKPAETAAPIAPVLSTEPEKHVATEDKKLRARAKKAASSPDDPQAALFDTLDQLNKKADKTSAKAATEKKPRSVKAKPSAPKKLEQNKPEQKQPAPKKAEKTAASTKTRKTKTGEASS